MKSTWQKRAIIAAPITAVALIGLSVSAQATPTPVPLPTQSSIGSATVAQLTYLRQEEQLARDVYTALAAKYGKATPFATIARSEQQHFDAIGRLLQTYGVADPAAGRGAGSYANTELQSLYTALITQGRESLSSAYQVGVTIETKDIADLKSNPAAGVPADVSATLSNLERASQKHLAAFTGKSSTAAAKGRARTGTGQPAARAGNGQGRSGNGQQQANCAGR